MRRALLLVLMAVVASLCLAANPRHKPDYGVSRSPSAVPGSGHAGVCHWRPRIKSPPFWVYFFQ